MQIGVLFEVQGLVSGPVARFETWGFVWGQELGSGQEFGLRPEGFLMTVVCFVDVAYLSKM